MKKNYMIISIDVEEAVDEIPYLLLRNQCFFYKGTTAVQQRKDNLFTTVYPCARNELCSFLTPYTK